MLKYIQHSGAVYDHGDERMNTGEDVISRRQIIKALRNAEYSAQVVNLKYINDTLPGIQRIRKGDKFSYLFENKLLDDDETLSRIKSLAIPPAWEKVWISPIDEGHLQATGYDAAGRKQYRYHSLWSKIRSHTKYFRMLDFGMKLPMIREKIDEDLKKTGMSRQKVMAAILAILDSAYIRIGNSVYEKLNGSYGLTTLKNKHAIVEGYKIRFRFIGKKGIKSNVTIKNRRVANIINKCKEIPGQQLFAWIEDDGSVKPVDSGMVNDYIKEISGNDYTAKDFRTWAGSVSAIKALEELGPYSTQVEMKRKINMMYDKVALELGNTRNVCRTHYVNPVIPKLYEENRLTAFYKRVDKSEDLPDKLKREEVILLEVLRKNI